MARIAWRPAESIFVRRVPAWKRGLDVVGATVGLLALAPLFAAIAALILTVSPGPVLFGQRRVGRGGAEFMMWKFRTMRVGTDTRAHERAVSQEIATNGRLTKTDYTAEYIRFGPLLRKASLDELPQLFNVLRGEMSLVGPRPEPVYAVRHYQPWHRRRLDVLPGMTGLWQVSGKNRTTFRRMLELDLAYAERHSLRLDLWILLRTPTVILADLLGVPASAAVGSDRRNGEGKPAVAHVPRAPAASRGRGEGAQMSAVSDPAAVGPVPGRTEGIRPSHGSRVPRGGGRRTRAASGR